MFVLRAACGVENRVETRRKRAAVELWAIVLAAPSVANPPAKTECLPYPVFSATGVLRSRAEGR
ncbi:MAG: hypothetical protein D6741_05420 [Planctomycetota bacterium]|nr:MAG: hypothetical protein D6741_05420 [Planctomycetota bacterium]